QPRQPGRPPDAKIGLRRRPRGPYNVREGEARRMIAKEGLEGAAAAGTRLSLIDGEKGRLSYRGYSIHDLAESSTFEEVVHLLWYGELPTRAQLEQTRKDLSSQRALHPDALDL